jgi:hypoxanthine phosphoribosyltransferase
VLFTTERIRTEVERLAAEVTATYAGEELTVLVVLHGGLVFAADLIRRLDIPLRLDVVMAASYHGRSTDPGALSVRLRPDLEVTDRHVLIVDDILDTGATLARLREQVRERRPRSLRTAVLLDKPSRRAVPIEADFRGLEVPDVFVVGYGLDWDGRWRNLPEIVTLPEPR